MFLALYGVTRHTATMEAQVAVKSERGINPIRAELRTERVGDTFQAEDYAVFYLKRLGGVTESDNGGCYWL